MSYPFETVRLTKRFDETTALDSVDLRVRSSSIVGLLGKNGSGKTTLIRHLMGQLLPSEGEVRTLGRPASRLSHRELIRIGFVPQEIRLLDWMTVGQHLDYVSTFYPSWDEERQLRLQKELELDLEARVGSLSTGNLQKLAVVLAVCHHPSLLILDEPVSDLDPIVRGKLLEFLLELVHEDAATILVSSHVLMDVEKIVDWVFCLDEGRLVTDAALDDLKERYAEWRLVSPDRRLPERYSESFVLAQEVSGREARLLVDTREAGAHEFLGAPGIEVTRHSLNLEQLFPLLLEAAER